MNSKSLLAFFMIMIMINLSLSSTFDLKQLQGCKKGDKVEGIRDVKNYLHRFGYLPSHHTKTQAQSHSLDNHDHVFDDALESAIKSYQINHNLKPTGILDPKTLFYMVQPRCGVADIVNNHISGKRRAHHNHKHNHTHYHTVSHYRFGYTRWPRSKSTLTYAFQDGTPSWARAPVVRALNTWASHTHFRFVEAQDYSSADIKVGFARGDHGDGAPFDGPGRILAHGFYPTDGRLHFDADDTWAVGAVPWATDLETTALHESGHLLGLRHSMVLDAIMFPVIFPGRTKGLHEDDIRGIHALYNDVV